VLRQFHPDYVALSNDPDPRRLVTQTGHAASTLSRWSFEFAANQRISVVTESLMKAPDSTSAFLRGFKERGFTTHVAVMAVPPVLSWQSCLARFVEASHANTQARWISREVHDAAFGSLRETLMALEFGQTVDRLTVVDRSGNSLWDNSTGEPASGSATSAFDAKRASLTVDDLAELSRQQRRLTLLGETTGLDQMVRQAIAESREPVRKALLDGLGELASRRQQQREADRSPDSSSPAPARVPLEPEPREHRNVDLAHDGRSLGP